MSVARVITSDGQAEGVLRAIKSVSMRAYMRISHRHFLRVDPPSAHKRKREKADGELRINRKCIPHRLILSLKHKLSLTVETRTPIKKKGKSSR